MIDIVGVRFRQAGKIYYFDPRGMELHPGEHVIVETARGVEYGTVILANRQVHEESVSAPLKCVIRLATPEDDRVEELNREKEREAYKVCQEKIRKHELDMKLVQAEYTFDNNKLLFYFTADGRIDFRELVKDLAGVFRTRIELRQIGVRDETKILGGVGICGRPLCCHTYLADFAPVSIKMAKEQNLSLNPTKISGACGRLMCCLKNEQETYEYLNSRLPNNGEWVTTPEGIRGEVTSVNVLRQRVKVLVENDGEKEVRDYAVEELTVRPKRRKERDKIKESGNGKESKGDRTKESGGSKEPKGDRAKESGGSREPRGDRAKESGNGKESKGKETREKEPRAKDKGRNRSRSKGKEAKSRENGTGQESAVTMKGDSSAHE